MRSEVADFTGTVKYSLKSFLGALKRGGSAQLIFVWRGGYGFHWPPLTVNGHKLCFGCTDNKTKV